MENLFKETKKWIANLDIKNSEFIDVLEKYLIFSKMKHYFITNKYETYIKKKKHFIKEISI